MFDSSETPWDVKFIAFRVPTRVHVFFWLGAAIIGWQPADYSTTVIHMACIFLSVLAHEFGHAFVGMFFGWWPRVVLTTMGGYTNFVFQPRATAGRMLLMILGGPTMGFLLFLACLGTVLLLASAKVQLGSVLAEALSYTIVINLVWTIFNLIPIFPLDGGQALFHLLDHFGVRKALKITLIVSVVVGIPLCMLLLTSGGLSICGMLFVLYTIENVQRLQALNRQPW